MSKVWVANASPVIALAKCGYLELLKELSSELLLPEPVVLEIVAGPESDPARQAVENGWGQRLAPEDIDTDLLEWGLGAGETAVLSVARKRLTCEAILDDAAARACAKAHGIPVIGTLGVVLRAKGRGLIPLAAEALKALRIAGLHLDNRTIRVALARIGEDWSVES